MFVPAGLPSRRRRSINSSPCSFLSRYKPILKAVTSPSSVLGGTACYAITTNSVFAFLFVFLVVVSVPVLIFLARRCRSRDWEQNKTREGFLWLGFGPNFSPSVCRRRRNTFVSSYNRNHVIMIILGPFLLSYSNLLQA